MKLMSVTWQSVKWIFQVNRAFFTVRPWTTLALILSIAIERFASILAAFLPLKVILLAGSDGVPRYFRFFLEPDDKGPWIIGLSAGAIGFFILTLVMERCTKQLAEAGSAEVLQGANEIAVASRAREETQGYFSRFGGVIADGVMAVAMLLLLGIINPLLFSVIVALFLVQYGLAAIVVSTGDSVHPQGLYRVLVRDLSSFLTVCSSLNFLAAFFVLLVPFLIGQDGNLLFAILSILLLRQLFSAVSGSVNTISALWKKKPQINPMIFRDHTIKSQERTVNKAVRVLFEKSARETNAAQELRSQGIEMDDMESEWQDSSLGKIFLFHLTGKIEGEKSRLQQMVFPLGQLHLVEHEEFLFKYISRMELKAPALLASYSRGPFRCNIYQYGNSISSREWKSAGPQLLEHCWSAEPPQELVRAFHTSRATLANRLTLDVLARITVALDHQKEKDTYNKFIDLWPDVCERVSRIPLFIYNPKLNMENVVRDQGEYYIMTWGEWTLEPIGANTPKWMPIQSLEEVLDRVRNMRNFNADQLCLQDVLLAKKFRELEFYIQRENYKSAIHIMGSIVRDFSRIKTVEAL
ncbi:hypothetical protein [Litchfieldella rifensis]|uniref:Uncharacterized protein n=1 Tax=Litchfieldella rifensis TaxID=762643 RepID=A0ABV7LU16_9GAMM